MSPVHPVLPLFVFGTLCDPDLRDAVLGGVQVAPQPAVLPGYRAVRVPDESYPVLSQAEGGRLPGMLLALEHDALDRVAFYEGDEYGFERVTVETSGGAVVEAWVCADRIHRTDARVPWSLEDWRANHKESFIPVVRRYMSLFGTMTATEADRVWQTMTSEGH